MRGITITEKFTNINTVSFKKYLGEVDKLDMLTPDKEYELSILAFNGDESARRKIVLGNLRFVISVAKQYASSVASLEDLVNQGNLGLIEASKRFDPSQGFKFITYAVWWIRRSIMEFLTKHTRTIRIPSNQANNLSKLSNIIGVFEQKLEHKATLDEIMGYEPIIEAGFSEKDIKFFLNIAATNTASLDKPFGDDSTGTLMNTLESNVFGSTDSSLDVIDDKHNANILINLLPKEIQKDVITRLFGLNGKESQDLRQIANSLDISRERVRQIKDTALKIIGHKARKNNLSWMNNH